MSQNKGNSTLNGSIVSLHVPKNFNFWRTVYSHGWCTLLPFSVNKDTLSLTRVLSLSKGTIIDTTIHESTKGTLSIAIQSPNKLTVIEKEEVKTQIQDCLRLKEDFSPFYQEVRRYPKYRWIARTGTGRMLRAPSVFEDIVKMICTTNCSWSLTVSIVHNLVRELGKHFNDSLKTFPSPEALAGVTETFLRKTIRAGYRAPYLLEFADRIASKKLSIEHWRTCNIPTDELFKQLRSIKGVGAYAAGNLLKLLGRYDYLGLDSWVRGRYYELYHKGHRVSDATIEKRYAPYG